MHEHKPPLVEHLEESGRIELLLPEERELLTSPELRALPPPEQWAYLSTNRRVGYWVTAVVSSLRLLLLGGGAVAAMFYATHRAQTTTDWVPWVLMLLSVVALAWAARTAVAVRRRLRELRPRLPPASDLELPES